MKSLSVQLFTLLIFLVSPLVAAPTDYESYAVAVRPPKKFAATRIPKEGVDWRTERFLRYSDKEPVNFAGKYTFGELGCGTGCLTFCLIDRANGKVTCGETFTQDFPRDYHGPTGFHFRTNSTLLVVHQSVGFSYPVRVSYYVLKKGKLKRFKDEKISEPKR